MDEDEQRLSSRKAVVATFLLAALALGGLLIFLFVLGQRSCSGSG
ncbi:MAG: hypothetical protein ABI610_08180 [Acidobacteriota bacterium]